MLKTDVVVIGAGAVGFAIARELSKYEINVIVVDKNDDVGGDASKSSGDPQLLRHFGIEPTLYDLIVVKANTSVRAPYSKFAGEICYADTPGAGSSNLLSLQWHNIPKGFYPFDLPEGYQPEPAEIRSRH